MPKYIAVKLDPIVDGDKTISIPTVGGPVAVKLNTISDGDKTLTIPTTGGPVAIKLNPIAEDDKVLLIPTRYGFLGGGRVISASYSLVASLSSITDLIVWDGYIYALSGTAGVIYRSADGTTWDLVTTLTGTNVEVCGFVIFGSDLFVFGRQDLGTYPSRRGCVWKTSDGTTWDAGTYITPAGSGPNEAFSCCVFGTYLYAICPTTSGGTPKNLYRSTDASVWDLIYTFVLPVISPPQKRSMAVLGGNFYIVFGKLVTFAKDQGVLIWESSDGAAWSQIADLITQGAYFPYSLYTFDSKLWMDGETWPNTTSLILNSSDGISWSALNTVSGHCYEFVDIPPKLFAAAGSIENLTTDGILWSTETPGISGGYISASVNFNDKIYIGTSAGKIYKRTLG